eukprot:GFUD01023304.1.p1 GENE.GFUD01023304.1~~GFUD01023304.1.p1  ORF type:complete len:528 (+),score=118.54 GFUD01023304.1:41-1585(+)
MGTSCTKVQNEEEDEHIAKQDVTLWKYVEGKEPESLHVKEHEKVSVLSNATKWWQVKKGSYTGFAARYYFARRDAENDYEKEPWFFGEVSRPETIDMLSQISNPEGSYIIRYSTKSNKFVLDVKVFDIGKGEYMYKHFDVKQGDEKFWFTQSNKFSNLPGLIEYCMKNKEDNLPTKLTNVCLIPNPHSDENGPHSNTGVEVDSWIVPLSELSYNKDDPILGEGQFGKVFKAKFRGTLDVAVKQLKIGGGDLNKEIAEKVLADFFSEKDTMSKLNHPNLVQLFAIVIDGKEGNFMIQEFMEKGDLKNYLKKMKSKKANRKSKITDESSFNNLLSWCAQVCRGMEHLEVLKIIHRDLAARNVLLDKFGRAKVADFGLALEGKLEEGLKEKLPVKWTAPEAMFKKHFSHKSDVWAFAILMWEIFSFGDTPYGPEVTNSDYKKRMASEFRSSKKIPRPLRCKIPTLFSSGTDAEQMRGAYEMMLTCWELKPEDRPGFGRLREDLDHAVATGDWEGYFD